MSVPDAKAWEVTAEDLELKSNRYMYSDEERIEAIAKAVARRRALAELRALYASFDDEDRGDDNSTDGLNQAALEIRDRIAAIEAEES